MEIKTAVKTFQVDYLCDMCKKYPMRPNNRHVPGYPTQYQHVCSGCGFTKNFLEKYPRQVFEEIPTLIIEQEVHHPESQQQGKTLCEIFNPTLPDTLYHPSADIPDPLPVSPEQQLEAALASVNKRKPSKKK